MFASSAYDVGVMVSFYCCRSYVVISKAIDMKIDKWIMNVIVYWLMR